MAFCKTTKKDSTLIDYKKYSHVIGIDPGTNTGLAIWSRVKKEFALIKTCSIIEAQDIILKCYDNTHSFLRIEDARLRTWFGKSGREMLQGAGSIKRDCSIWQEWCEYHGFPFEMVAPKSSRTKMPEKEFRMLTKYEGRTSVHSRDAAAMIIGY